MHVSKRVLAAVGLTVALGLGIGGGVTQFTSAAAPPANPVGTWNVRIGNGGGGTLVLSGGGPGAYPGTANHNLEGLDQSNGFWLVDRKTVVINFTSGPRAGEVWAGNVRGNHKGISTLNNPGHIFAGSQFRGLWSASPG